MANKCDVFLLDAGIPKDQVAKIRNEVKELIKAEKWDKASKSFIKRTQQEIDLIKRNDLVFRRRTKEHIKNFDNIINTEGVDGAIKAFDNLIVGSREAGQNKVSIELLNKSIKARNHGFFNRKLSEFNVKENLAIEKMQDPAEFKSILKAMEDANNNKDLTKYGDTISGIARALNDTAVYGRDNAIAGGVELNIRLDHLITQKLTHNQAKMLSFGKNPAEAKANWVEKTLPRLNKATTFPNLAPNDIAGQKLILANIFEQISENTIERGTGSVTRARKLNFLDAERFADQHAEFGEGTLLDIYSAQMNGLAKGEALHTVVGPRAEQMLDSLEEHITKKLLKVKGVEAKDKFINTNVGVGAKFKRDAFRRVVIGHKDTPGASKIGEALDAFRDLQTLKLGAAALNTPTDLAVSTAHLMSTTGMGPLAAQGRLMREWSKQLSPSHRKQMAWLFGIDSQLTMNRLTGEESTAKGLWGKFHNGVMKATFLDVTTKINQGTLTAVKANVLAEQVGKSFDQLDGRMQGEMKSFGIDEKGWEVLRKSVFIDEGGQPVVAPHLVAKLGGRKLENQYSALLMNNAGFGAIMPDARSKVMFGFGINPESVQGKFLANLFMFKSFSARAGGAIGEIIKNNPAANNTSFFKALRGQGNMQIMGTLATMGFATATVGLWARDLLFGKTPRDMTMAVNAGEALSRSVMPIWGEYLIQAASGDMERRSVWEVGFGPGLAPVTGAIKFLSTLSNDLQSDTRSGVASKKQLLEAFKSVVPGRYMPIANPVLEMSFFKSAGKWVDDKYDQKFQKNLNRTGQNIWYR